MTLSSAAGVDLKHNLCTLVLHSVVDDLSLENIFIIICLLIGWSDHRLIISNHFKVAKKDFYRTTNIAITTPTIINTDAPNIPPTSIGKLSDDDSNGILFKVSRKNVDNSYDFCWEKEFRLEYNNSNWYGCTFSGYKKIYLGHIGTHFDNHANNCRLFCHMSGWYSLDCIDADNSLRRTTYILGKKEFRYLFLFSLLTYCIKS